MLLSCNLPPAAAAPVASPSPATLERYAVRAESWGSLFYQLDCLAGQGYCSESSYRALWQSLGWTAADDLRIEAWQKLRQRYERQIQLSSPAAGYPLPPRFDGIRFWDKVRQASFNARDRQELAQNLAAVLRPADAEQLMSLLAGFETRFRGWWNTKGQGLGAAGAEAFKALLAQPELPALIEQASRFYRARLSPWSVLAFNFIPRPDLGDGNLNGEQVENQSLIEVKENSSPTSNLDVSLHEFSHYHYARASQEDELLLIQRFAEQGTPEAIAAYNLLNEVLATAIGNGLFNRLLMGPARFSRYLQQPGSFYNDAFIDPLAKAVYPRVEAALLQGEAVNAPGFVRDYLQLASQTLGDRLRGPVPLLRTMAAAYEGQDLAPVLSQLQRRMRVGSVWSANALDATARNSFERFASLSGVLLLKPEQLPRLKEWEGLLGSQAVSQIQSQPDAAFVFGLRRGLNAWIFVIVAPDVQAMNAQVERLAAAGKLFEGSLP
ncbi:MAG TPA: hypothetical protein V6D23_16350 [Candidatus Obscuribacterales bacterium]